MPFPLRIVFFNGGIDEWDEKDQDIDTYSQEFDNIDLKEMDRLLSRRTLTGFDKIEFRQGTNRRTIHDLSGKWVSCAYNELYKVVKYTQTVYSHFSNIFQDAVICGIEISAYAIDDFKNHQRQLIQQYTLSQNIHDNPRKSIKFRSIMSNDQHTICHFRDIYQGLYTGAVKNMRPHQFPAEEILDHTDFELKIPETLSDFLNRKSLCFGHIQFAVYFADGDKKNKDSNNQILICNVHLRVDNASELFEFIDCLNYLKNNFFKNYRNIIIGGDFNLKTYNNSQIFVNDARLGANGAENRIKSMLNSFNILSDGSMRVFHRLLDFNLDTIPIHSIWPQGTFIASKHRPILVELKKKPLMTSLPPSQQTFSQIQNLKTPLRPLTKEEREHEQQLKEQQLKEQQLKEQQLKEQQLKEQQLKEQQLKEQQLKEQQLKEQQLKEQQLKEQQLKEQQLKEQQLKEQQLKEQQLKERQIKEQYERQIKEQQERQIKEQHERQIKEQRERQIKEQRERQIKERRSEEYHWNGPPLSQQYGPPQGHGPPPQWYGPSPQGHGPPPQGHGPPPQWYGPPPQGYGMPPSQWYGPPPQWYGPPPQGYGMPSPQGYGMPSPQGYGPPPQGYGRPQGHGISPQQWYELQQGHRMPPPQGHGPPQGHRMPPSQGHGPPQGHRMPPSQGYGPPQGHRMPPPQGHGPPLGMPLRRTQPQQTHEKQTDGKTAMSRNNKKSAQRGGYIYNKIKYNELIISTNKNSH